MRNGLTSFIVRKGRTCYRRGVALLLTLCFAWTLVVAPAVAGGNRDNRMPSVPSEIPQGNTRQDAKAEILAISSADEETDSDSGTKHCACLVCGGEKTCCCKPNDSASFRDRDPDNSICFRALCDRAATDISLPFLWSVAVLPTLSTLSLVTSPRVSVMGAAVREFATSADRAVPETPPRSSSCS
jgi:hypothetical protein